MGEPASKRIQVEAQGKAEDDATVVVRSAQHGH
jgi:hypothetical protein